MAISDEEQAVSINIVGPIDMSDHSDFLVSVLVQPHLATGCFVLFSSA